MARRVGLDGGSREVLLDLIYRLSLDDKAKAGAGGGGGAGSGGGSTSKSSSADGASSGAGAAAAAQKERVKEARRDEKEQERKEKVLRKALKEDRKETVGGGGGGSGAGAGGGGGGGSTDVSGLAATPFEEGTSTNIQITSAGGETKLMSVKRAGSLDTLLTAAKQGRSPPCTAPPGHTCV
jgi:hypothetical protein